MAILTAPTPAPGPRLSAEAVQDAFDRGGGPAPPRAVRTPIAVKVGFGALAYFAPEALHGASAHAAPVHAAARH